MRLKKRLDRLRDRKEPTHSNNNISPPSPPSFPPPSGPYILPPAPPQPPNPFQSPKSAFSGYQPPPPPPPSSNNFGDFHIPAQLSSFNRLRTRGPSPNIISLQIALTREREQENVFPDQVQEQLDDTIYELLDPPT